MRILLTYTFFIILFLNIPLEGQVLVLGYHKVTDSIGHNKVDHYKNYLEVDTEEFEKQIKYLKHTGFSQISPLELINFFCNKSLPEKKCVLITFDDAYKSVILKAYPIMKKYGFAGVVFINSATIGKLTWTNDHIDLSDIEQLISDGWIIGNHTHNHIKFNNSTAQEIIFQINTCQQYIDRIQKNKINIFAYPSGFYNGTVIEILKKLDFKLAFTTHNNNVDFKKSPFLINRYFPLFSDKIARFKTKIRNFK